MESGARRRLMLGFAATWISRLAGTIIQLVQVPVFLHYWSVGLYGDWLQVNALPAYLSFSNIGFGSVAGNEMTMMMGREDRDGALRVFQSCWWLIVILCSTVILLLGAALALLPVTRWLNLQQMTALDAKWVLFALGTAVLFGQLEQLVQSAFTCIGRYPFGTFVKSVMMLISFAVMIVPVLMGYGVRAAAGSFSIANLLGTIFLCVLARHHIPWLRFGWRYASFGEIRRLTPPALAFMGFPVGNALNLQGTLLVVGHVLGSVDVVIFGTARTVSRVALQLVQMVNTTFWPELSRAFGAGDMNLVRTLHRRSVQLALASMVVLTAGAMIAGPWFLTHWTAHKVPPSPRLLFLLLISVVFYSMWSTSSTLLAATNRHNKLAVYYVAGTTLTVIGTYVLAKFYGLYGAAASLMISELVMNAYVLPATLKLSEDGWPGFLASMLQIPASVRPAALAANLRRTQEIPPPESEIDG